MLNDATKKKLAMKGSLPNPDEGGIDYEAVVHGIRKHWPLAIALTVLAAGLALLYSKAQSRIYQSSALLDFDPNPVRPLGEKTDSMMGWVSYFDTQQNYETQFQIIKSESVLSKAVRDLGLQADPRFIGSRTAGSREAVESATAILRSKVVVEPVKNSHLFYIRVEDTDAAFAQRLCASVSTTYRDQNLKKSVDESSDAALWLSGQVDHYGTELKVNEEALHAFKKQNELPSSTLEEVSKMIRLEMQSYDDALTHTRTRKQELSARHSELAKITLENVDILPASELLNSVFLQQLRGQYLAAKKSREELIASGKGENHPLVKSDDEKVIQSKRALVDEVRNIQGAVERDLAVIQREETGKAGLYEDARKRAVELNMKELEFHRLDRQRAQNEKMYDTLLERMKEADLARMMRVNNVDNVDEATSPKAPIRPNTLTNLGAGSLIGLVLGLAIAILREHLDTSIKAPGDIEEKLGLTFLGLLPALEREPETGKDGKRRRRRGDLPRHVNDAPAIYVHQRPLSGIAEASRTVRTNLTFMSPDKPHRIILVTSSAPAEGKTTVACSLAIAMAQSGHRVCIIDCDLRRPKLHRVFSRVGDEGLTSVLVGEAQLLDVAKPAQAGANGGTIPNLWCIPAGSPPPNPADLLQSERFKKVLAELGEHFDRVVIDSPPLAAVTDSAIISTLVDATIFVVRAFGTSYHLARQGLRALYDVDAPVAGAVLNAVDLNRTSYSYYYQQYYYYRREGYRALDTETERESAAAQDAAPPPN
jgi:Mrp family chromosome partitioning ATPase